MQTKKIIFSGKIERVHRLLGNNKKINNVMRYWHTLRHLRPVQFYGRAWHRLYQPHVDNRLAPDLRRNKGHWIVPTARPPMMLGATDFRFLNVEGGVANQANWNDPDQAKLWLYNLHYFDDLNAAEAKKRTEWHCAFIERWIAENPPPYGNGWEPYPLSLRIINWIKWGLAGNEFEPHWQNSLAVQIRFLAKRLEWHLLGNHLFANAKALVFAGLFFEGCEADHWRDKGLAILAQEIPEQILPDGGHFELSPMYHSIILEDILDLINLADTYPGQISSTIVQGWRHTALRMLKWLAVMSHPDGRISFFNDATFGIAPEPQAIEAYAERLDFSANASTKEGMTHLIDSGYVRVQKGDMVALLDVGRVGPDYLPGHAHADTLSFELSLFGQRVIVNSGISQYGFGQQRLYQRSTKSHSTVGINGQDSSEVWDSFRVARRASPIDLNITEKTDVTVIRCAHDGYHRLKGHVTHQREWHFGDRSVKIIDTIAGNTEKVVAHFYYHPDIKPIIQISEGTLVLAKSEELGWQVSGGNCAMRKTEYYPEFGRSLPNSCLMVEIIDPQCSLKLSW